MSLSRFRLWTLPLALLVAASAIAVVGCEAADAANLDAQIIEPSAFNPATWGYAPEPAVVMAGDTVTWANTGNAPHTVTAYDGSFDSGIMLSGQSWTLTTWAPGEYSFYCTLHPDMIGTLIVQ